MFISYRYRKCGTQLFSTRLKDRLITFVLILYLSLAANSCGGGGGSTPSSPTNGVGSAPSAPTNVSAEPGDGQVTVSWSSVTNAESYNIYWSYSSGVTKSNGTKISGATSSYVHTGLTNGTTYYYVVTASNLIGESAESSEVSATPVYSPDPLYADQWHLKNTGQSGGTAGEDVNVEPVWSSGVKGDGVRIAIVDDGLEIEHEDLSANVTAGKSYDYVDGDTDPSDCSGCSEAAWHGTSVAGVAAARDLNGIGVRGAAPHANLVGYNYLMNSTISNEVDAMTRDAANVYISSNSWGATDGTGELSASMLAWRDAVDTALTTGRGGRGTVFTWAAGNGAPTDNSNYDGRANYRGVIAIGAVNDQGTKSSYSEEGANVWVGAPAGEYCDTHTVTTTDRTGSNGYNNNGIYYGYYDDYSSDSYTKCFNGTSSATPLAAGIIALILDANPNLTWRDVRLILAETARKNDSSDTGWTVNGAGYNINHKYGFGVIDAEAAVNTASSWTDVGAEATYTTAISSPNLSIPDNNTTGVSSTITVSGSGVSKIEYVEIYFSALNHPYAGDLEIILTGPGGTTSTLAETHACSSICGYYNNWRFGSVRHLGEAADGNWTLTVRDKADIDTGTFQSWSLTFYGR